jgi:hypothetical protein
MTHIRFDAHASGIALVTGYIVMAVALFRNPADGLATATATGQGAVFFLLLPLLGILSGIYSIAGGPLRTPAAVFGSSYLGVVGVALTFLPTANPVVSTTLGLFLFLVAVFALLASLQAGLSAIVPETATRN